MGLLGAFVGACLAAMMRLFMRGCRFCFPASHRLQVDRIHIKSPHMRHVQKPNDATATIDLEQSNESKFLRIIQLSDFHYQSETDPRVVPRILPELLEEIIEVVNKEQPDLIMLTGAYNVGRYCLCLTLEAGDFVEREPGPITDLVNKYLVRMQSRHGIYAVNGNHCNKRGPAARDQVLEGLRKGGIKVLFNESTMPLPGLELVGLGDISIIDDFNPEKAFSQASTDPCFRIVLSHNPDTYEQAFYPSQCGPK